MSTKLTDTRSQIWYFWLGSKFNSTITVKSESANLFNGKEKTKVNSTVEK